MQDFASLPGPHPAQPSGSQGSPTAGTHPVSPGCGAGNSPCFFQATAPSLDLCPGSPCALLAVGALSVQGNNPLPSWVPLLGARIRDLGSGVAEGEKGAREPKYMTLTPEMGGGCFSLVYCH